MEQLHSNNTQTTLEEVTTVAGLQLLVEDWRDLWRRCPAATPFQSPDWCVPWWEQFGGATELHPASGWHGVAPQPVGDWRSKASGSIARSNEAHRSLWVLAVRCEKRLVGLAPFYIRRNEVSGEREVLILGTGISDYLDILLEPSGQAEAQNALLAHLQQESRVWDVCDLQQLRPSSPCLGWELGRSWRSSLTADGICPVLPIDVSLGLRHTVPARMLDKLTILRRRARREGHLRYECADHLNFEELFAGLLRLHSLRWTGHGVPGSLQSSIVNFHRAAARRLLDSGILRLYGLYLNEKLAAASYGFCSSETAFLYLSGFDPQFAELSPPTLLIGHALERAALEGARDFDFLRGRETYKYMWGARGRFNCRRRFRYAARDSHSSALPHSEQTPV